MTFHVDRTAVNADGDEFEFPTIKQLLEDFEIDFSEHAKEGWKLADSTTFSLTQKVKFHPTKLESFQIKSVC